MPRETDNPSHWPPQVITQQAARSPREICFGRPLLKNPVFPLIQEHVGPLALSAIADGGIRYIDGTSLLAQHDGSAESHDRYVNGLASNLLETNVLSKSAAHEAAVSVRAVTSQKQSNGPVRILAIVNDIPTQYNEYPTTGQLYGEQIAAMDAFSISTQNMHDTRPLPKLKHRCLLGVAWQVTQEEVEYYLRSFTVAEDMVLTLAGVGPVFVPTNPVV